jgi:hypothetical protein
MTTFASAIVPHVLFYKVKHWGATTRNDIRYSTPRFRNDRVMKHVVNILTRQMRNNIVFQSVLMDRSINEKR